MSNPYYNNTGYPQFRAPGKSEDMRAELKRIESGLDRLPDPIMPNQPVFGNASGTGMVMKDKAAAKALLGLENVDNTADADKPISADTAAALATKADADETTAALATKADADETTAALAAKADAAETTDALATKADTAAVTGLFRERPRENLLINGGFDHWDYGTSQTATGFGSSNRWAHWHQGTTTKTHSRQIHPVGGSIKQFFSRTVVTSGNTSSSNCLMTQKIENVQNTAGKKVSISIRVKADSPKNIAIRLIQSFGVEGSPSPENIFFAQKIAITNEFAVYTIPGIQVPDVVGKVLGTDGRDHLGIAILFDAGSDYADGADNLGNQSGTFDIDWVKLEIGDTVTDYVNPDKSWERLRCERYYQSSHGATGGAVYLRGYFNVATSSYAFKGFSTHMRVVPSINLDNLFSTNCSFKTTYSGQVGFLVEINITGAGLFLYATHWTADAEI